MRNSPRLPTIRASVLEALGHSLCASRLSLKAQTHACEPGPRSFHEMAQASDQMIDALESLLETLKDITLALEPRDIDLSRAAESRELTWPPAARKPAKFP